MAHGIRRFTVKNLISCLRRLEAQGQLTMDTEVWLSSDEEGNHINPFVSIHNLVNAEIEEDKSRIVFFPSESYLCLED